VLDIERGNMDEAYLPSLKKTRISDLQSVFKAKPSVFSIDASAYHGEEIYLVIKGVKEVSADSFMQVTCNGVRKEYAFAPKGNLMWSEQRDVYLHFGVVEEGIERLDFSLGITKGDDAVAFDGVELHSIPVNTRQESYENLEKVATLQDVALFDNKFEGTITTDTGGYLVITLPYSEGWTAYVDGKETTIYQADTAFMALQLKASDKAQTISFYYETPYYKEGKVVMWIGVGMLGGVIILDSVIRCYRKNKKQKS
jgi:hypothetical protein